MTDDEVRDLLRKECAEIGGQRAWAKAHGFSPQYIHDILAGRRLISEKVAAIFGLTRGGWVQCHTPVTPVSVKVEREEKGGGG